MTPRVWAAKKALKALSRINDISDEELVVMSRMTILRMIFNCILMNTNPLRVVIPRTLHKNSKLYKLYHEIQVKHMVLKSAQFPVKVGKPGLYRTCNEICVLFLDCLDRWLRNLSRQFFMTSLEMVSWENFARFFLA
jgi:hypothetical protein